MWKKEVPPMETPSDPLAQNQKRSLVPPTTRSAATPNRAVIGPGITIRGDVVGKEDLVLQGQVDGSVDLKDHSLTVGPQGKVLAHISARLISVEGTVEGDLTASEKVVLRGTARVLGDIFAPRVVMEDGASFLGSVDMGKAPITTAPSGSSGSGGTQPESRSTPYSQSSGVARPSDAGMGTSNSGTKLAK
jgi:cytoskeletal protein CcmA (bactofilin family)